MQGCGKLGTSSAVSLLGKGLMALESEMKFWAVDRVEEPWGRLGSVMTKKCSRSLQLRIILLIVSVCQNKDLKGLYSSTGHRQ